MQIVIAISSAVGASIIVSILNFVLSWRLFKWRLDRLETKVDEHNNYAQKFGECQKDIALMQKDIEYIKNK